MADAFILGAPTEGTRSDAALQRSEMAKELRPRTRSYHSVQYGSGSDRIQVASKVWFETQSTSFVSVLNIDADICGPYRSRTVPSGCDPWMMSLNANITGRERREALLFFKTSIPAKKVLSMQEASN